MRNKDFSNECFYKALITLMKEKPFEDIQIRELCETAGFNRSTFYRAYNSKMDIITNKFKTELKIYEKMLVESKDYTFLNKVKLMFSLLRNSSDIFIQMHRARLDATMYLMFTDIYPYVYENDDKEYYKRFRTAGMYITILTWLLNGMEESDEEMAYKLQDIMNSLNANY